MSNMTVSLRSASSSDWWRKALMPSTGTLQDAIRNLDDSGLQIALVVSTDDVLIGTITDGDIRRGLLRGLTLSSSVDTILHREPLIVPPSLGHDTVLQLMQANIISALPVVDERRRVVGLHLLNKLIAPLQLPNLMLIMAGGEGRRLRPHTESCPKPLLPVAGKPMLEHIVERARSEGFVRFAISVHYLSHMIEEYFGGGERWQAKIEYLRETSPLGTGGAIGLLNPRPDAPFVVSNGDVLTQVRYADLLDYHIRHMASATMAVRMHEWQHPFGVVRTDGVDIIGFDEKPITRSHINAGIYVFEPDAIDMLNPNEPCDIPTIFARLRAHGQRTVVYPVHEPWLDLGATQDYMAANGDH